jgi:hypothetical protein
MFIRFAVCQKKAKAALPDGNPTSAPQITAIITDRSGHGKSSLFFIDFPGRK